MVVTPLVKKKVANGTASPLWPNAIQWIRNSVLRILLCCCLIALIRLPVGFAEEPASEPNLLFLYIDDLNTYIDLPVVNTPHIDSLANRGVKFSNAYASHPVCTPSRVSLLTGQLTHHTQAVYNGYDTPQHGLNGVRYLPGKLYQAGYYTACVGKVFHFDHPECWDAAYAFSDDPWIEKPEVSHLLQGIVFGGPFMNGPDGSLGKMGETKNTDETIRILDRAKLTGQPFAIWQGFSATHVGFIYPERFLGDYTEEDVPDLPDEEFTSGWKDDVCERAYATPSYYDPDWAPTEEGRRRQAILAYFRCISYIDEQIGRVLDHLDELQFAENTIIVLVSDHGFSFSEHDHIDKTTGFDEDIRTPLVIADPAHPATHGQTVTQPVSHVDLYPTLMDLLSMDETGPLDGKSLVPLMNGVQFARGPVFYTTDEDFGFNLTRWVVKEDASTEEIWKLGAWENDDKIQGIGQLYNLSVDPGEYYNLYAEPSSMAKVVELRQDLRDVDLLGPSWRQFSIGVAGYLGVPDLEWTGIPVLGNQGSLFIGNSAGQATHGLLCQGFSGAHPVNTGMGIEPHFEYLINIPSEGLVLPFNLPANTVLHEMPMGFQVQQVDQQAPNGVAVSRALGLFLTRPRPFLFSESQQIPAP